MKQENRLVVIIALLFELLYSQMALIFSKQSTCIICWKMHAWQPRFRVASAYLRLGSCAIITNESVHGCAMSTLSSRYFVIRRACERKCNALPTNWKLHRTLDALQNFHCTKVIRRESRSLCSTQNCLLTSISTPHPHCRRLHSNGPGLFPPHSVHSFPLTLSRWVDNLRIEMLCDMNFYARVNFINLI